MSKLLKFLLIVAMVAIVIKVSPIRKFLGRSTKSIVRYMLVGKAHSIKMSLDVSKQNCSQGSWNNLVKEFEEYVALYEEMKKTGIESRLLEVFVSKGDLLFEALVVARGSGNGVSLNTGKHISSGRSFTVAWNNKLALGGRSFDAWAEVARHAERYIKTYKRASEEPHFTSAVIGRVARRGDALFDALIEAREATGKVKDIPLAKTVSQAKDTSVERFTLTFEVKKGPEYSMTEWNKIAEIADNTPVVKAISKIIALLGSDKSTNYTLKYSKE